MTLRERIARAICAGYFHSDPEVDLEVTWDDWQEDCFALADGVLLEIEKTHAIVPREATLAMTLAALKALDGRGYQVTRGYIDADDVATAYHAAVAAAPTGGEE